MRFKILAWTVILIGLGATSFCGSGYAAPANNQINAIAAPTPPPIGDGSNAPLEIAGDGTNTNLAVATGQYDATTGNVFPFVDVPSGQGFDRTVVHLYRNTNGGPFAAQRGTRADMTLRADQLSAAEMATIGNILGIDIENGMQTVDKVVTEQQLEAIQKVLFPYPQSTMVGPHPDMDNQMATQWNYKHTTNQWKKINTDTPAPGYPRPGDQNLQPVTRWIQYLPTVRKLGRFLILAGVVSATVLMAFAAFAVVLGHKDGGKRVIGTAGGFMLLLMGFTIWKILRANAVMPDATNPAAVVTNRPTTAPVTQYFPPDLPVVPGAADMRANPTRSGTPVQPLYGPNPVAPQ